VNPSHTPYELEHAFRTAEIKALVVEPELLPNALRAAQQAGIPRTNIFSFDHHIPVTQPWDSREFWDTDIKSWRYLMGQGETDWVRWNNEARSKSTTAARLFSSGTTGLPKAVEMTHHNFIAQHTMVLEHKPRDYEVIRLLCTPMFHVSNVPRAHTSPLRSGILTYVMRRFELQSWLHNIERFGITEANMVPPMVIQVINSPLTKKYSLKSIRNSWVGAAPLAAEPQARYKALLQADTPFNQVWGMSETSCIATMVHYPEQDLTGSVGRFLPNMDAKLVDEEGRDITDYDVRGELCARGPLIVKGYYNNPQANAESWDKDGYFHTGDIAVRRRDNGLWYIVDRKKVSRASARATEVADRHIGAHQSPRFPSCPRRTRRRTPLTPQGQRRSRDRRCSRRYKWSEHHHEGGRRGKRAAKSLHRAEAGKPAGRERRASIHEREASWVQATSGWCAIRRIYTEERIWQDTEERSQGDRKERDECAIVKYAIDR
jgi:4-coumarate--CoA ligase